MGDIQEKLLQWGIGALALSLTGAALFIAGDQHATNERDEYYGKIIAAKDLAQSKATIVLQSEKIEHDNQDAQLQKEINEKHQRELSNEKDKTNRILADYSNGSLRLRDKFQPASCPSIGQADAGTSTGTVLPASIDSGSSNYDSAQSGLQKSDIDFLVQLAADADEVVLQLQSCQAVIAKDRNSINK